MRNERKLKKKRQSKVDDSDNAAAVVLSEGRMRYKN